VCSEVVEKLAHREYRERALVACFLVLVLALKKLEEPPLQMRPQEVVHAVILTIGDVGG
jgi:hypothetical protein